MTAERDAAVTYSQLDLATFPLHPILPDGRCGCAGAGCDQAGKHPIPTRWQRTIPSESAARSMWRHGLGDRGIGLACGARSGVWGLDVDIRDGGDRTLAELVARHGRLPRTWASRTGSGGLHFLFKWTGEDVRNSAGRLGQGLDVRGEGGYLVLPPSRHASGERYRWMIPPDGAPLAPAPDWLLERIAAAGERPACRAATPDVKIPRGRWHDAIVSLGGVMRRWGADEQTIDAALVALAEHQFLHDADPIDWEHIHKTAADIARRY